MLEGFTEDAGERYRSVVSRVTAGAFLVDGMNSLLFPVIWYLPLIQRLLEEGGEYRSQLLGTLLEYSGR